MGMLSVAKFRMGWGLPSTRSTKSPARKPVIGLPVRSTTWASTRVIATSLLKTTGSSAANDPRTIVKKRAATRFIAGALTPRRESEYPGFEEIRFRLDQRVYDTHSIGAGLRHRGINVVIYPKKVSRIKSLFNSCQARQVRVKSGVDDLFSFQRPARKGGARSQRKGAEFLHPIEPTRGGGPFPLDQSTGR